MCLDLQRLFEHIVRVLDLVDVQLQFGQVLPQFCIIRLSFDRILLIFNRVLLVMVVDQRFADLPDQLPVDLVPHAVLRFLVVHDRLVRFANLHQRISDQNQVADRPLLFQDVEEAEFVEPPIFDVREVHVRESLLRLHPDRRVLVDVFQNVDGLLDLAEGHTQLGIRDEQPDFLTGALELGDAVTHDLLGFFEPLLD